MSKDKECEDHSLKREQKQSTQTDKSKGFITFASNQDKVGSYDYQSLRSIIDGVKWFSILGANAGICFVLAQKQPIRCLEHCFRLLGICSLSTITSPVSNVRGIMNSHKRPMPTES